MSDKYIPINKGNYSMDTEDRERAFDQKRGAGWMMSMLNIEKIGVIILKSK